MEFTVENFCGFLIRSKLLTPDEVKAMYTRWQDESRDKVGSVPHFTKWLVARSYVTEYQSTLLMKAQIKDFFLGDYKILDRIGRGRMAGVYKAQHAKGQLVAIKVLPPSQAKNGTTLARFQREAKLAMKLQHPNIVRSYQLGEANELHFLVMEYLEGETLEEVLARRKKLPAAEAARVVQQALLGLQHIGSLGMVHRDMKPSNLMLTPPPSQNRDSTLGSTVKILDIGLGREMYDEDSISPEPRTDLTGEGVLLGTPDYLAPEQARDPRNIDVRADIYSLGCVLYHCLTGQTPFPDKNLLNQMVRHAGEQPKPIKDFSPDVPDSMQQIVNAMMAKKAEQRYPTPDRAAQALQAFLTTAHSHASVPEAITVDLPPEGDSKKRERKPPSSEFPAGGTPAPATKSRKRGQEDEPRINVELFPLEDFPELMPALWGFTHRDWKMLGIGGGVTFLLCAVIFIVILVLQ